MTDRRQKSQESGANDGNTPETIDGLWNFISSIFAPLKGQELVSLAAARGRVLAGDVLSAIDVPRYRNAAMDGFAISGGIISAGQPWRLPVTGRSEAGDPAANIETGSAIRTFTGAALPPNALAVVRHEDCQLSGEYVCGSAWPVEGHNIREAGEDFGASDIILSAGTVLEARHLAAAAAGGRAFLRVHTKVRVGIVVTGKELVTPGAALGPGQIYESNGTMSRASMEALGGEVTTVAIVGDDKCRLTRVLDDAAATSDLILVSGGMARSETDYSREAVMAIGGEIYQHRLRLRPGKPALFGRIHGTAIVGLPGNPFAAFIALKLFAEPIHRRLSGRTDLKPHIDSAVADFSYARKKSTDEFLPARIVGNDDGRRRVTVLGRGASAKLLPLVNAEGLCHVTGGQLDLRPGSSVEWWPLSAGP